MLKHTFCSLRRPPVIPTKPLSSSALVGAVGSDSVKNMAFNLLSPSLPLQVSSHKESMTMRNSRSICSCPRNGSIQFPMSINFNIWKEFRSQSLKVALAGALALTLHLSGSESVEAKVGVNKPELLPKEFSTVIDVAGFLSDGQESRLRQEITDLEKSTGFKLRVLAQNYPETPGLAVRDFWQVDDRTIVFVADPTFGNILNFNIGATVDLDIPRSFWSRLAGKYGNIFYLKEKGEDASIEATVKAISTCLREPVGPYNCSQVR
ncbi:hypothetical protein HPP92_009661 [Vanilla planifolia]|nr:hypothetical protein HPP92_009661 [Vanilla planifolia]